MHQHTIFCHTRGRGLYDITDQINHIIRESTIQQGLCQVFCCHTSASLLITENCDPNVHRDIEMYLSALVQDGDPRFRHTQEGDDDMSAHIRTFLSGESKTIPVSSGSLALGTWQGLYVYEHRYCPQQRRIIATLIT